MLGGLNKHLDGLTVKPNKPTDARTLTSLALNRTLLSTALLKKNKQVKLVVK